MKNANWLLGILALSLLPLVGCGKSGSSTTSTGEVQVIDASKFRPAFETAPPDIKAIVDNVMMSIQGSMYKDALAGLDKLANTPTLTEAQKKVVASLTEQVKKKAAAMLPAPPQ
jgi:hypothetical protein